MENGASTFSKQLTSVVGGTDHSFGQGALNNADKSEPNGDVSKPVANTVAHPFVPSRLGRKGNIESNVEASSHWNKR